MDRTTTIVVLVVVLSSSMLVPIAAADDADGDSGLSQCDSDKDDYKRCLRAHTTVQDVIKWIRHHPDELTDNQQSAIYVFDVDNSSLSESEVSKVNDWRNWAAGGDRPSWFVDKSTDNGAEVVEKRLNEDVYVSDHRFNITDKTATFTIHNDGDSEETVVVTDTWSVMKKDIPVSVTAVTLDPNESTTVTVSSSTWENKQHIQTRVAGDYESLKIWQNEADMPWEDEPSQWDYVWAFGLPIIICGVLAVVSVAIFLWLRNRKEHFNTFDKVHRRI